MAADPGSLDAAVQKPLTTMVELWNDSAMARLQVLLAALCFATTGTAQALGPNDTDPVGVGAARILVVIVKSVAV